MANQGRVRYNEAMETMTIVLFVIFVVLLVLVSSMWPDAPGLSVSELERRRKQQNRKAIMQLRRVAVYEDLVSLRYGLVAVLVVLVVMSGIGVFDFGGGVVMAIIVALLHGRAARVGWVHQLAQWLYGRIEPGLVSMISQFPHVARSMRTIVPPLETEFRLGSRDELKQLIRHARPSILAPVEREQLMANLEFADKSVKDIMLPRTAIATIDAGAIIGPLLLDELHRTGHKLFPVIQGDLNHIIGILSTQDIVEQKSFASAKAQDLMNPAVFYIDDQQSLERALAAFITTEQTMFVVTDTYQQTVGLLLLADCVEALMGHSMIIDDDDLPHEQQIDTLSEPPRQLSLPADTDK